jgi:Na+-transporting NADH:ubiquinone oxidoreductase subunit C
VDALSGATFTTRGVENLVNFWTGELGFGPYIEKLKINGVAQG